MQQPSYAFAVPFLVALQDALEAFTTMQRLH